MRAAGVVQVDKRAGEVQQQQEAGATVVVMCRRGNDSRQAAEQLRQLGVENVVDLVGGVHAWADEIDSSMPKL